MIEAGRMITEAMQQQRSRDSLDLMLYDAIVAPWQRISKKLVAKGWIEPTSPALSVDEAIAQADAAIEQL